MRDIQVWNGSDGLENVTENVDHGEGDDRLELSNEHVSQDGSENRGEVNGHRERVVDRLNKKYGK